MDNVIKHEIIRYEGVPNYVSDIPVEGDEVEVKVDLLKPSRELGNTKVLKLTW